MFISEERFSLPLGNRTNLSINTKKYFKLFQQKFVTFLFEVCTSKFEFQIILIGQRHIHQSKLKESSLL